MKSIAPSILLALWLTALIDPAPAQDAGWNGTWKGLWGSKAPTAVTVTGGKVVGYKYLGRSHQAFDVVATTDSLAFSANEVTGKVTLTRTSPDRARAEFVGPHAKGRAVLKRF